MNHNYETPDYLDGLGDMLPAELLKKLNELLEQLQRSAHPQQGSNVINIYASGSQHVDTQYILGNNVVGKPTNTNQTEVEPDVEIPPPEVMVKAVEKTIDEGLWGTNTCWSVVYVVYRILGYEGTVTDFVRDVASWKFTRKIKFHCNRDSVGKPLRDKRMSFHLDHWVADGVQKPFYQLAVALMKEIKKIFPSFPSDIPNIP